MQRKWKRRWQRLTKAILPPVAAGLLFVSAYSPALANPAGGTVVSGSAAIASSGSTMTVNQTTNKAVINWQSFSIDKGETVNFIQPNASSVALNRVVGSDASNIYGSLNANGKVYLINPNGVLFAPGSSVNVGGLVASTLNISDSDFLNGNYTWQTDGSAGSVVNQGTITATNEAVLIGSKAANEGVIAAKVTGLAAGSKVSLDFSGDSLLSVTVDTGALNGSATNNGTITASGGLVLMSAGTKDTLLNTVVNNSGVIRAQSVNNVNGVIRLEGNTVTNSGTLDASGKAAGQTGGTVKLLGDTVTLKTGSTIDVSGDAAGGITLIGGAYQGGSSEYAATNTTVQTGATINADAITSGNGGTVVVWANDTTNFAGTITAKGGSVSGNGGSVETSGKRTLVYQGHTDTTAVNGQTGSLLLDPGEYTISTGATGGNVKNVDELVTELGSNNITLATDGIGTGDITVSAPMSWDSSNTLTLSAQNNIYLNSAITATNGGLTLAANIFGSGDGTTTGIITPAAGSSISVGTFTLQSGTWREISSSLSSFYAKDFRISGGTFIRALGGNGTSAGTAYQIADVYGLQGIGSAGMLGNYYTLANTIDASGTVTWNSGAGFAPIGNYSTRFTGSFDGGGHTITGLTVYRPSTDFVGLFGYTSSTAIISSVGLIGGSVTGNNYTGGLVGDNYGGSITNSYSTGAVKGSSFIGGLVGVNDGTIKNSYSTGAVIGSGNYVGGLVGDNYGGSITNSYSTGEVTGSGNYVGGLVGRSSGSSSSITNSYSTSTVTGNNYVGGLSGGNTGSIKNSYSTGAVKGSSFIGGLVGMNDYGTIKNSYSTGAVIGTAYVGGLVGHNSATITASYYATTDETGAAINSGSGYSSYGTGKTLEELTDPATFSDWGNDISATGGSSAVWRIYAGCTTPLLRNFLTPLTVTVAGSSTTYDGSAYTGATASYSVTPDSALLLGTLSYTYTDQATNTAGEAKNAGTYIVSGTGLYSSQQGYDITYVNGTLTIAKQAITYSVADAASTYGTLAAPTVTLTGLVSGDAGAVTGTVALTDNSNNAVTLAYNTAAGSYTESVSGLTGTAAGNYELSASGNTNGTLTIAKKTITYSVADASGTYGTLTTTGAVTLSGLVSGDENVVSGTVALTNSSNQAVTLVYNTAVGGYTESVNALTGTASGNYVLAGSGNTTGTLTINPKTITYNVANATGTYGTLASTGTVTLNGLVSGDESKVTSTAGLTNSSNQAVTLAYNTAAGTYTESVSGLSGTAAGNYEISTSGNTTGTLTIARADLTITASNQSKTYGKSLDLGTTAFGVNGLVTGDSVTSVVLTSSGADATAKAGKYTITAGGASGSGLGNYNIIYADGVLTVQSFTNPAYDGAVSYADHMANGLHGPLKPYGQPYGLGGASGYQAGASGSAAPLTIVGTGINTGGYLLMSDTAQ